MIHIPYYRQIKLLDNLRDQESYTVNDSAEVGRVEGSRVGS
jgi:hypothetical protein